MNTTQHTENGTTYRVGATVLRADYENDGTPAYDGTLTDITVEDGEATYWIIWHGAGAVSADPHGPHAFTLA